jgi:uncharacterized protein (TIGR00369 family)
VPPDPMNGGERTRTFTWQDPMLTADVSRRSSGIELLRAMADGSLAPPPIAQLLDMTIEEAEAGRVLFALEPAEWMYNPIGSVHGGVAATILDSCMGCAVHTLLPAGVGYTTADLQVRYSRGMTVDTGRVLAEGKVIHAGRRLSTAEGRLIVEGSGKLIAHATAGCIVLDQAAASAVG